MIQYILLSTSIHAVSALRAPSGTRQPHICRILLFPKWFINIITKQKLWSCVGVIPRERYRDLSQNSHLRTRLAETLKFPAAGPKDILYIEAYYLFIGGFERMTEYSLSVPKGLSRG